MTRELLSHPDTRLKTHLQQVMGESTDIAPDELTDAVTYAAAFHDIGKATTYFQDYIRGERTSSTETHHWKISALAAYYAAKRNTESTRTALIAAHVVYAHHKHLSDTELTGTDQSLEAIATDSSITSNYHELKPKAESLQNNADAIQAIYDELLPDAEFTVTDFCEWILEKEYTEIEEAITAETSDTTNPLLSDSDETEIGESLTPTVDLTVVYAALRIGDIKAVTGYEIPDRRTITESAITKHINAVETNNKSARFSDVQHNEQPVKPVLRGDETIDELRSAARREALHNLHEADLDTQFFDIQLPTGLGKTLTGLETAATIRTQKHGETGETPRIIYAMPQTTIIDQNHDTLTDAFTHDTNTDLTAREALKHHHASTETHTTGETDYGDYDYEQYLTRRWDAELITTTFVQLFESLITPRKQQTHRFESLQNAVIVLDEVQALPSKYWEVIQNMLPRFADMFDWTVITMTATDPQILSESTAMIRPEAEYFERVNRVTYTCDDSITANTDGKTPEETAEYVTNHVLDDTVSETEPENGDVDSALCIMNTISQAEELYEAVKEQVNARTGTEDDVRVIYLSSNLPYSTRKKRLQAVTSSTEPNEKQIIVSTQVTETGVDMTTDVVIRELAPIDSLIQAGGRCNRNTMTSSGRVHVINTESEYNPENLLYGKPAIETTRDLLTSQDGAISDGDMTTTVLNEYYDRITTGTETDAGMEALQQWAFDTGSLNLINTPETLRIVTLRSDDDEELLDDFTDAVEANEWGAVDELQSQLQEVVVTVNVYNPTGEEQRVKQELPAVLPDTLDGLYRVDARTDESGADGSEWYDEETGFTIPDSDVDVVS